jgi:hypothetical protein
MIKLFFVALLTWLYLRLIAYYTQEIEQSDTSTPTEQKKPLKTQNFEAVNIGRFYSVTWDARTGEILDERTEEGE